MRPEGYSLDVTVDDDGRSTVLVTGELDLARADEFADAVREALDAGPVLVDLSAVTFLDSAGVRALNTLARDASDADSELRLVADLRPNVVQVLELTGMMAVLPMEDAS